MKRRPPRSTRTDTRFPYTTLFRSLAGPQAGVAAVLDLDQAIDLRCVGHRARDRQLTVDRVDDAALHAAHLGLQLRRGNPRLAFHEARQPLLLHVLVDRVRQLVGLRTFHRRVGERADAVERSEEHTSELQSLMRISYAVFFLKKIIHYSLL